MPDTEGYESIINPPRAWEPNEYVLNRRPSTFFNWTELPTVEDFTGESKSMKGVGRVSEDLLDKFNFRTDGSKEAGEASIKRILATWITQDANRYSGIEHSIWTLCAVSASLIDEMERRGCDEKEKHTYRNALKEEVEPLIETLANLRASRDRLGGTLRAKWKFRSSSDDEVLKEAGIEGRAGSLNEVFRDMSMVIGYRPAEGSAPVKESGVQSRTVHQFDTAF